jgi:hypothetical protein
MLDQISIDQMQVVTIPMHDLSPLLTHPDFMQGISDAQECFFMDYQPAPLTEDEMINEVEICIVRPSPDGAPCYYYWLGYAYGIINEGLAYASSTDFQQEQYSPASPLRCGPLSALRNRSDFLDGVSLAQECFLDQYASAPLTEDEMVSEVKENLNRKAAEESKVALKAFGSAPSYIHRLGFVFGTINEGLAYTTGS